MFKEFKVDNKSDTPIYMQLSNLIRTKVAKGELAAGEKMPTVRELSASLGIAQGTVKRAYDELESLGVVEKAQGKGTFITFEREKHVVSESRKDRAMESIDGMFDELESMGFSMSEIEIFLELKKREREARREKIKIALVECNTEVMSNLVDQMRSSDRDIYPFLLNDIKNYPYKITEDMNLIITTATHFDELCEVIPDKERMVRVALSLTTSSVHDMLMIPRGSKVGVLCASERFGAMILREIEKYDLKVDAEEPIKFESMKGGPETKKWLSSHDYILLPENYEKYCSAPLMEAIGEAKGKGKIILCSYKMDMGSELLVEERIKGAKYSD